MPDDQILYGDAEYFGVSTELVGRDRIACVATRELAGRSGDRIPVGGVRSSAPVQTDSGAHPVSCITGIWSLPCG